MRIALMVSLLVFGAVVNGQQAATASLSGRVLDPTGAVIPGASVTAKHNATGIKRETQTSDEGLFVITNLMAGDYQLSIRSLGFAEKVLPRVTLEVGQDTNLNIDLAVAATVVTLDETFGFDNLIDTSMSVVDAVINTKEIDSLPLNGRNFLELALLIPGNSPAPNFDPTKTNTVVISSAGQLGRGGNVTVDGADNNDDVVGGAVQNVSQEAVQEFQVATNRFSAQMGRSGSSVINLVTKGGSNDLHGAGSFYFRHKSLQGLPATFDRTIGQAPPFHREQYAFALGGPIKRDVAWFFGSIEYRNQKGAVLVGERNLATRSILRRFAPAPLDDTLNTERFDWQPANDDHVTGRYSFQRQERQPY